MILVRDVARRLHAPTQHWPRWLGRKWVALVLFAAVLFVYELYDLWALPAATAWLVIGYFGAAVLVDHDEDRVAVAVEPHLAHPLAMTRRLALDPVLLPRAAPVRGQTRGERAVQGLVVHPADHQHLAGAVLLRHGHHETVAVSLEPPGDGRVEVGGCSRRCAHGPHCPACP